MMGKSHTGKLAAPVVIARSEIRLSKVIWMLSQLLSKMKPEERVEVFDALQAGYCRACGADEPPGGRLCQCQNDE
jgi:hypothetical protein